MNRSLKLVRNTVAAVIVGAAIGACGGSGDSDVNVTEISPDTRVVPLGGGTVIAVDATFDSDRVTDGSDINLVVRLPAELRYRAGSGELDGFTSEDDNAEEPIVTDCQSSEQFLAFEFSNSDLLRALNPSGDADLRLNLTVDGVAASGDARISAAAGEDLPAFACGQPFNADTETAVQVQ